jgi:hypothetical protein
LKIAIPTASTVFTTITLFEILCTPFEQIGFGIGWILTVRKVSAWIAAFLDAEELVTAATPNFIIPETIKGTPTACLGITTLLISP